jgi:fluoroacetyl-CoA thioesterase
MRDSLQPGLTFEFQYEVPESRTVPFLLPESSEFRAMPKVLATGYLVGLIEWTCIQAINPHLNWPKEQTVGTDVKFSHVAATPPGLTVTIKTRLEKVEGRRLVFSIIAYDGVEKISEGIHERFVIDAAKFNTKIEAKVAHALQKGIS